MALKVARVDTWAASIEDRPGALADALEALAAAGANLELVIARRAPERAGSGVVFVTPIRGARAIRAARNVGFATTEHLHTVRVEGSDRKGIGGKITRTLAERGLNLRGLSAAAVKRTFVAYIALDSAADATKTVRALRGLG